MATYTPQNIVPVGVAPIYHVAAAGGDKVAASGNERDYIHVKNGGGSGITVTIPAQVSSVYQDGVGNLTPADIAVAVGASGEEIIGPIPQAYIGADGNFNIMWSAVTSVTFATMRLPAVSRGFA